MNTTQAKLHTHTHLHLHTRTYTHAHTHRLIHTPTVHSSHNTSSLSCDDQSVNCQVIGAVDCEQIYTINNIYIYISVMICHWFKKYIEKTHESELECVSVFACVFVCLCLYVCECVPLCVSECVCVHVRVCVLVLV